MLLKLVLFTLLISYGCTASFFDYTNFKASTRYFCNNKVKLLISLWRNKASAAIQSVVSLLSACLQGACGSVCAKCGQGVWSFCIEESNDQDNRRTCNLSVAQWYIIRKKYKIFTVWIVQSELALPNRISKDVLSFLICLISLSKVLKFSNKINCLKMRQKLMKKGSILKFRKKQF